MMPAYSRSSDFFEVWPEMKRGNFSCEKNQYWVRFCQYDEEERGIVSSASDSRNPDAVLEHIGTLPDPMLQTTLLGTEIVLAALRAQARLWRSSK